MMGNIDKGAVEWLEKNAPKEGWADIYFKGHRYGHFTSNIAESINAWLLNARDLPILPLLDTIRTQLMDWFQKRRQLEAHNQWTFVSTISTKLQDNRERARRYRYLASTDTKYEVKSGVTNEEYLLDFQQQICSCHEWEIYGYPCGHTYSIILSHRFNVEDFVQPFYCTEYHRLTYSGVILHPGFIELHAAGQLNDQSEPASDSESHSSSGSDNDMAPPATR